MSNILVSVIIPTYKRAKRLDIAIKSVLNQSYNNIEIIVVDDNNDGDVFREDTQIIMNNFKYNNKVHYLKHNHNLNGSAARNTGINFSKGKYIAFLDDDDVFLKTKIEKQVDCLEQNPEFSAVCCSHTKKFKNYTYKKNFLIEYESGNYLYSLLSGENDLAAGSTLMIKRDILLEMKGFDVSFKRHQDWEFLVRFFRLKEKLKVLNEHLVLINVDGDRNYPNADDFLDIKLMFFKLFKADIESESKKKVSEIYNYQFKEVFAVYWKQGRFTDGLKFARKYKDYFSLNSRFVLFATYSLLESKFIFLHSLKYKMFSIKFLFSNN